MITKHTRGVRPTEQARREANRDKVRLYARQWRHDHPELVRAASKRTRIKNKARIKVRQRQWAIANRVRLKQKNREWYLTNRNRILKKRTERMFNLPPGGYEKLLKAQNYKCLICGRTANKRLLSVDHDHKTGQIRGLLCTTCNIGIGHLRDDPILLDKAAMYLRTHTKDLRETLTQPEILTIPYL